MRATASATFCARVALRFFASSLRPTPRRTSDMASSVSWRAAWSSTSTSVVPCRRVDGTDRRRGARSCRPRVLTRGMATGGNNMDDARRRSHARATRAIPLKLVIVSKGGGKAMDVACKEWSDKIKRYAEFEEVVVKTNPKNAKEPSKQLEAEGERVMKHIAETDYVILCDERGEDLTSEELSAAVADAGESNARVAFVVGGPFGHGPDVVARANRKIRLSSMVMNHQVARFVLLEQIYRTWTILKGEPYHH